MAKRSLLRVLCSGAIAAGLAAAQSTGGAGTSTSSPTNSGGANPGGSSPGGAGPGGSNTGTPSVGRPIPGDNRSGQSQIPSQQTPTIQTPIYVTGNVLLANGGEPPDRVEIIRVCSVNNTRSTGYTDAHGGFSVQVNSQNTRPSMDAADGLMGGAMQGFPTGMPGSTSQAGTTEVLADCELRARLAGYRSSSILLAGRRPLDSPNIGTLVLYPISLDGGEAISATSAGASKEARKSFDKGVSEAKKGKLENAEKELRKAVELYPKYAAAWTELGKTLAARKKLPEAHHALTQAIEADPRYVYPYEQLYMVAFELEDWDELAKTTARLVQLNPYEFPGAYYYNGVAHYQLKNWDAAEKSIQEAIKADPRKMNPKSHYVLGLVQIQQKNYAGATRSFTEFTTIAPNDPQIPKVQTLLNQLQQAQR